MSTATKTNACKLLLLRRCIHAVLLSVGIQFVLLTVFLLFVNFQLLHPFIWVASTFRLVCSFYTWFASIPLLGAVVVYGITLCQQHLAEYRYCPTRYRWLLHNGLRKLLFMFAHLLVGYLTAWLYTGYLHTDYRHLFYKCYGQTCLSSYHIFLVGMGATAGLYHFFGAHFKQEVSIEFAIVKHSHSEKLREVLYATLLKAPIMAALPTLCFALFFWLCGGLIKHQLSHLFDVDADERVDSLLDLLTNLRLVFYAWLLTAQILSNMHLMQRFYATLLAEDLPLVIARTRQAFAFEQEVTVVAALGVFNVYVVQCSAAHYLYKLARLDNSAARLEIFQLTEPGNRAANWRALCDQCLSIIGGFTDELVESMRSESALKINDARTSPCDDNSTNSISEKLLLRQYNQLHGIRLIASPLREFPAQQPQLFNENLQTERVRHMPNWCERISNQLEMSLHRLLQRIPGMVYLFSEPEGAKISHLLSNSLPVMWLTQALAHICVASLNEDRFGVVQGDLPAIINALQRLKGELDKLGNVLANTHTENTHFIQLQRAVRRSLYNICSSFYECLKDLFATSEEVRQLQNIVHQE